MLKSFPFFLTFLIPLFLITLATLFYRLLREFSEARKRRVWSWTGQELHSQQYRQTVAMTRMVLYLLAGTTKSSHKPFKKGMHERPWLWRRFLRVQNSANCNARYSFRYQVVGYTPWYPVLRNIENGHGEFHRFKKKKKKQFHHQVVQLFTHNLLNMALWPTTGRVCIIHFRLWAWDIYSAWHVEVSNVWIIENQWDIHSRNAGACSAPVRQLYMQYIRWSYRDRHPSTSSLVAVEPRMPPKTNVDTKTAFRHDHCKTRVLRSEVSWCDQTQRSEFTLALNLGILDAGQSPNAVSIHAGTSQVDFEVDRPPPAACPPGDLLITMVKKTVILYKKEFRKMKKSRISHWSESDENAKWLRDWLWLYQACKHGFTCRPM